MFEGAMSPLHWLVVLLIALVIFGPRRLPELGKGLGSAIRNLREGLRGNEAGDGEPGARAAKPAPGETIQPKR